MKKFVALLRGVNVSGKNLIKMAELRMIIEDAVFQNVKSYIQSGNLIFESPENNLDKLAKLIQQKIKSAFGFGIEVLVTTPDELVYILENLPPEFQALQDRRFYFIFLLKPPEKERIIAFSKQNFEPEKYIITDKVIYFYAPQGYGNAKLNNNLFEKKLNVTGTTRNLRTLEKLIALGTDQP